MLSTPQFVQNIGSTNISFHEIFYAGVLREKGSEFAALRRMFRWKCKSKVGSGSLTKPGNNARLGLEV